jgi:hypothetical protein
MEKWAMKQNENKHSLTDIFNPKIRCGIGAIVATAFIVLHPPLEAPAIFRVQNGKWLLRTSCLRMIRRVLSVLFLVSSVVSRALMSKEL